MQLVYNVRLYIKILNVCCFHNCSWSAAQTYDNNYLSHIIWSQLLMAFIFCALQGHIYKYSNKQRAMSCHQAEIVSSSCICLSQNCTNAQKLETKGQCSCMLQLIHCWSWHCCILGDGQSVFAGEPHKTTLFTSKKNLPKYLTTLGIFWPQISKLLTISSPKASSMLNNNEMNDN